MKLVREKEYFLPKLVLTFLICSLLFISACGKSGEETTPTPEVMVKKVTVPQRDSFKPTQLSKKDVESNNNTIIFSEQEYLNYINSVKDILAIGPLNQESWSAANQVDPDRFFNGFLYLKLDEIEGDKNIVNRQGDDYYISTSYYENYIKQYFTVSSDFLETSPHYSASNQCYIVNVSELGFGDAGNGLVVKAREARGNNIVAVTVDEYDGEVSDDTFLHTCTYLIDQSTHPYKWVGWEIK